MVGGDGYSNEDKNDKRTVIKPSTIIDITSFEYLASVSDSEGAAERRGQVTRTVQTNMMIALSRIRRRSTCVSSLAVLLMQHCFSWTTIPVQTTKTSSLREQRPSSQCRRRHYDSPLFGSTKERREEKELDTHELSLGDEGSTLSSSQPSPISYALDELGSIIGGTGRAKACWDCFRIGIDPIWFWNYDTKSSISTVSFSEEKEVITYSDDYDDEELIGWTRQQIYDSNLIDPKRVKNGGLGKCTLKQLKEQFGSIEDSIASLSKITTTTDGTTKLLLKLHQDNLEIETVIIPWHDRQSSTLCVSSQVGCKQACTFCSTGRMGKLRSLSTDEILAQLYWANKICRLRQDTLYEINNVVFMGMGEPADNVEAVYPASQRMMDARLFQLASRRVTISTVAPSPDSFRQLLVGTGEGSKTDDEEISKTTRKNGAALAWSVHATRDDLRKQLVPTTQHTMEELRQGLIDALKGRSRRQRNIMLEITLLDNINDTADDAHHLIEFCQPILNDIPGIKLVVNLIPWNDIDASFGPASLYKTPQTSRVLAFQKIIADSGLLCYVRTTRGDDESAACGMLATKSKKAKNKK